MKRKGVLVFPVIFMLFLLSILSSGLNVEKVKASGTIYIRADGNIDPPTAPIQRNGDIYILTGDMVNTSITVERDNIVIDGNHSTLHGFYGLQSRAFYLDRRNNVTIRNISIDFYIRGIYLADCSDCKIHGNNITNTETGILLQNSTNTYVYKNNVTGSGWSGIELYQAVSNNVQGNLINGSLQGIRIWNSSDNTLKNNTMVGNSHNFGVASLFYYFALSELINDVDASNTVDGKPIYYWVNEANISVPSDAGCVVLVNCTHIRVEGLSLQNNLDGLLLAYTSNSTIHRNNITDNIRGAGINSYYSRNNDITENNLTANNYGLDMYESSYNTISRNRIVANEIHGIKLQDSSNFNHVTENNLTANRGESIWLDSSANNTVSGNTISTAFFGIVLNESHSNLILNNRIVNVESDGITIGRSNGNRIFGNMISEVTRSGMHLDVFSRDNTIYGNTIAESYYGLSIGLVNDNIFHHNNLRDNTDQMYTVLSLIPFNSWNNSIDGNYWSDYNGPDLDHDGKGDSPYILDLNNIDHHPLMGTFSDFNTSLGKHVNVISNSTIEDFTYFESNSTIKMHVSNMTGNQTHGFVRITIPHSLMTEPYNITVDGVNPTYWNYNLYDNGTHRWIYFAYEHSTLEIVIIPEFPSLIMLPLFITLTLLAAFIHRRRKLPKSTSLAYT